MKKPWGDFKILDEGKDYKVKRLSVNAGAQLSLQSHKYRNEYWKIVSGTASIIIGEEHPRICEFGKSVYIPARTKHRLGNHGMDQLIVIEIQTGSYLEEDDITRYEDNYGRVK